jgi:hypothetical protein
MKSTDPVVVVTNVSSSELYRIAYFGVHIFGLQLAKTFGTICIMVFSRTLTGT